MRNILPLVILIEFFFPVVSSAQHWCWTKDDPLYAESGGSQSASLDNLGNIYVYANDGGLTPGIIIKRSTATGAISWTLDSIGGAMYSTFLTNDAAGYLYEYYDSGSAFRLAKISPAGSIVWVRTVTRLGSTGSAALRGLCADRFGHIYVTGYFTCYGLVAGADTLHNAPGDSSCYYYRFDTSGNVQWSRTVHSPHWVCSVTAATDSLGDIITGGYYSGAQITLFDTTLVPPYGGSGLFAARLDSNRHLQWITFDRRTASWPANTYNQVRTDGAGNVYFAGTYSANDTIGAYPLSISGGNNIFVAKYRSSDGHVLWATTGGHSGSPLSGLFPRMYSFATNAAGNSLICFTTDSVTARFGDSVFNVNMGGSRLLALLVVNIDSGGHAKCGSLLGGNAGDDDCNVALDDQGFAYINGDFDDSCRIGDTVYTSLGERYFTTRFTCHCGCSADTTTPSVTITVAPGDTVCSGTVVTFTPTYTGTGSAHYTWQVNGAPVSTGATFSYTPSNLDIIQCIANNDDSCMTPATVLSNTITMHIVSEGPTIGLSVAPGDTLCAGDSVTITATTAWVGSSATYQWKKNGANVGIGTTSYTFHPVNGDSVRLAVSGSYPCFPTGASSLLHFTVFNCHAGLGITGAWAMLIYPNPAHEELIVHSGSVFGSGACFTISDVSGRTILSGKLTGSDARLDVSQIENGLYLCTISDGETATIRKLEVTH